MSIEPIWADYLRWVPWITIFTIFFLTSFLFRMLNLVSIQLIMTEETVLEHLTELGASTRHVPREAIVTELEREGFDRPTVTRALASLAGQGFLSFRSSIISRDTEYMIRAKGLLYEFE